VIPLLWLIAGVLLIAVELVSGALVMLMLGGAALVTAGASALGAPLAVDVAVFGLSAAALVLLARPALNRRLHSVGADGSVNGGPRTLLGTPAEVVEPITGDEPGTVRIGGAVWTARALHTDTTLLAGATVVVVDIRGATAVVAADRPVPPAPSALGET
jgi:membrane protein implicated in regulation of membrane protease activity